MRTARFDVMFNVSFGRIFGIKNGFHVKVWQNRIFCVKSEGLRGENQGI